MAPHHHARYRRQSLIAITHLADLLCRVRNLGYGYEEWRAVDLATDPGWIDLAEHCPKLSSIDLARFTMDSTHTSCASPSSSTQFSPSTEAHRRKKQTQNFQDRELEAQMQTRISGDLK